MLQASPKPKRRNSYEKTHREPAAGAVPAGRLLPAVTPQADAVISTVIGTSLKMCTSLVKGGIYACRNGSEYDNAGQGVLAVFKYAGSDLLGIDFGGSSSGQTKETVIQKVDLSKVEAELSSISKQLEKNSAAIHQLERTVSNGIASLSQQMENLSGQNLCGWKAIIPFCAVLLSDAP